MGGTYVISKGVGKGPWILFGAALLFAVSFQIGKDMGWISPPGAAATSANLPAPTKLPVPEGLIKDELEEHHFYPALDIPVPKGTPVYAVVAGTARPVDEARACGIGVVVTAGDTEWTYCHLSHRQVNGGGVAAGDQLGVSGSTGATSTGPHLHLQIKREGKLVCPHGLIQALMDGQQMPAISSLPITKPCA